VKSVLDQYLASGKIIRPFFGIAYLMIDEGTSAVQNLPQGAYVSSVVSGSPADKAGVSEGDVVTKFGDVALKDGATLASALSKYKVGDTVAIEVWRNGKTLKLKATLVEAPQ
jgi:S1-C subfamily serine protease